MLSREVTLCDDITHTYDTKGGLYISQNHVGEWMYASIPSTYRQYVANHLLCAPATLLSESESVRVRVTSRLTDSQPDCLGVEPHLGS